VTDLPTPERLRAGAAAWSLRQSLAMLHDRQAQEDRAIADERAAAADPLKSPVYGGRQALGGHSDPTSDALLVLHDTSRANRYSALADEVGDQLSGVAQHLPEPMRDGMRISIADPLRRIESGIQVMSKTAATATWRLLDKIDGRVRRLLGEPQDRQYIPRARCPWCDAVSLSVRLAPPRDARVVECTTCDGAWLWTEMAGERA
jgi:hypothetical protein